MPGRVLIIDDEEQLRKLLTRIISLEGFDVSEAATLKAASEKLKANAFDVILCDVKLPDGNGVDFTATIKKNYPAIEIILLTAYGNIPDGISAMKNGAFDYIVKGDDNDRIIPLLNQAIEKSTLSIKTAVRINDRGNDFSTVIGKSKPITEAISIAAKTATTDIPVLLLGETGTGKEVFANAIHSNSKRKSFSFVAINCSAFNTELLESELFGHKAGSFTGAVKDKKGLVEIADKGTLFLDEVGELSHDLQAKLLRFLENGEFIKLGDTKVSKTDTRIIAATNRNLGDEVKQKQFREDLYYRLNAVTIQLPALRERKGDLPLLISHFLQMLATKENKLVASLSSDALHLMEQYRWKGNIRELKNVLARAILLSDGLGIKPAHLPYEIQQQDADTSSSLSLAEIENQHIRKILQHTSGNKTKTAQLLEIGLATLYRKMEQYGISK